jgi:hypothetical protein
MEIYQLANLNLMSKKTATLPHRNTRPAINYHSKRKRIVAFSWTWRHFGDGWRMRR